jgi:hypothetical protein
VNRLSPGSGRRGFESRRLGLGRGVAQSVERPNKSPIHTTLPGRLTKRTIATQRECAGRSQRVISCQERGAGSIPALLARASGVTASTLNPRRHTLPAQPRRTKGTMSPSPWIIYALVDPRDGRVRYVGKTCDTKMRLKGHMGYCVRSAHLPVSRWAQRLKADRLRPVMVPIETGTSEDWGLVEAKWIAAARCAGCDLLNLTTGGEGLSGLAPESRKRISDAAKERWAQPGYRERILTPERSARIAQSLRGRPKTSAHIAKLPQNQRGRVFTDKHKAKLAEAQLGRRHSEETIAKMREVHRGNTYGLGNKSRTGQTISAAERRKRSQSSRGVPKTPEHRARIAEGQRRRWASGTRNTPATSTRPIAWPPFEVIEHDLALRTYKEVAEDLGVKATTLMGHVYRRRKELAA